MNAIERTLAAARNRTPWWAIDTGSRSFWWRSTMALRGVWHALRREPPERRYERRVLERMARGELIETLGVHVRDEARTRRRAEQWLAVLVEFGLRSDHLCVEYGCGSLWCAEPVIRHLLPGGFIGLDATDRFYEFGRQRLGSLLTEKRVRLGVISRRRLAEVAALKPDLVYSHKVLHHVPRRALARYVRNLASLLDERTILVIEHARPLSDRSLKGKRYGADDIQRYLPRNWRCRQEPFGLLITHESRSLA